MPRAAACRVADRTVETRHPAAFRHSTSCTAVVLESARAAGVFFHLALFPGCPVAFNGGNGHGSSWNEISAKNCRGVADRNLGGRFGRLVRLAGAQDSPLPPACRAFG